jgi:CHAD domain-containing protein
MVRGKVAASGEVVTYTGALAAGELAAALKEAGYVLGRVRPAERTLLDTFDGRLHAAGIRLEVRKADRTELVVHGPRGARAQFDVERPPRTAADLPAGPVRARLAPLLDVRALLPQARVSSTELPATRRNGEGKAVVAATVYDRPQVVPDGPTIASVAAEIHPFEGYPKGLKGAVELLTELGMERHGGLLAEVAAARAGVDLRGFAGSPAVTLDPSEPALDGFQRVLSNLADTVDANLQGTLDDLDPEFLHDLRVAVRRTRSVLGHGKQVLPNPGRDHFRTEFRWLGEVTSPSRDLDVYVIEWEGYVAPLGADALEALAPVIDLIARRRAEAHGELATQLASARYEQLMQAWRTWLDTAGQAEGQAQRARKPLGQVVATRLASAQERVLNRGRSLGPESPAEELHELRKDAKRLRYLFECFGTLLPSDPRKSFVSRLKALQDNLGEHQDSEIHSAELHRLSVDIHGAPGVTAETMLAMGRLTELFEQRRRAARLVFAERFAAYDTKATAKAFDGVVRALDPS